MAVSIWEGSKAQALIDAITATQKVDKQQGVGNAGKALVVGSDGLVTNADVGVTDTIKTALLACFRNVAWANEDGQTYNDALEAALNNTSPVVEDWDWKYESSSGELLSENENFQSVSLASVATEAIVNGYLRLTHNNTGTGGSSVFTLLDGTCSKGKIGAKVRFITVPIANSNSGTGFRLQLSNSSDSATGSGVQVMERKDVSDGLLYWVAFEGSEATTIARNVATLETDKWYTIIVERTENAQKIYVDDVLIFESSTMSTYYMSGSKIVLQSGGVNSNPSQTEAFIVDIEWIAFKSND